MIRKKMILADPDTLYLKEIGHEMMQKAPQIDLITYTSKEKLCEYLERGGAADMIVVDEQYADDHLKELTSSMTRIVLISAGSSIDGFEPVKKYQRIETLINSILLKYAEESGTPEIVRGDSDTRIAVFYSPAGGTGKTTLALALATAGVKSGRRVLYLNLEEIDSVKDLFAPTPGNLSDIFLALKTKGMNAGLKLKESVGVEQKSGFYYISGVDSISEFEEIDREDIKKLFTEIRALSGYDLVVIDLASGFHEKSRAVMECADIIFVPLLADEGSISKLSRFLEEAELHDEYDVLFQRMRLVVNKTAAKVSWTEWVPGNIREKIPFCAEMKASYVFVEKSGILSAGDFLLPIMNPLLQAVTVEGSEAGR